MSDRIKYIERAFGPTEAEATSQSFDAIVRTRRSVRIFDGTPIPETTMRKILEWGTLAPNSSNLQPWEFYWVRTPEKKRQLAEMCLSQKAASTAAELVVCVARRDRWKWAARKQLAAFDEIDRTTPHRTPKLARIYYEKGVWLMYAQGWFGVFGFFKRPLIWITGLFRPIMRGPSSIADMRVWAHKSTALAAENLMLGFRAAGFDSCPMEGIDSARIAKMLNLPCRAEVCMVLGAGKRAEFGVYAKQVRFPMTEFIKEV